jgi:hypothetical protein
MAIAKVIIGVSSGLRTIALATPKGKITAAHIASCNAQNSAGPLGGSVGAANIPKCRRSSL